jgi:hypothetical protein
MEHLVYNEITQEFFTEVDVLDSKLLKPVNKDKISESVVAMSREDLRYLKVIFDKVQSFFG